MFEGLMCSLKRDDPDTLQLLMPAPPASSPVAGVSMIRQWTSNSGSSSRGSSGSTWLCLREPATSSSSSIPYRAFARSRPVQALACAHFAHNWLHYTMLAWLPTYFVDTLSVDLMHAAQTALLPPLAGIVASAAAGTLADRLVAAGLPTATVRRMAQCTAFLVPSVLLVTACHCPCTPEENSAAIACITLALGMSSFSMAGLYCTHQVSCLII